MRTALDQATGMAGDVQVGMPGAYQHDIRGFAHHHPHSTGNFSLMPSDTSWQWRAEFAPRRSLDL
ncbi:hypothetical protein GCM10023342_31720 [Modicisalibacter zincidurans]|uniref:Uncharacterized protein n=1 Tax=Modicisalibacter zincidurans TaxID=1178777 RepID=A0ABP9RKR2_9GAMM